LVRRYLFPKPKHRREPATMDIITITITITKVID
jgi:hypothetical protein